MATYMDMNVCMIILETALPSYKTHCVLVKLSKLMVCSAAEKVISTTATERI